MVDGNRNDGRSCPLGVENKTRINNLSQELADMKAKMDNLQKQNTDLRLELKGATQKIILAVAGVIIAVQAVAQFIGK